MPDDDKKIEETPAEVEAEAEAAPEEEAVPATPDAVAEPETAGGLVDDRGVRGLAHPDERHYRAQHHQRQPASLRLVDQLRWDVREAAAELHGKPADPAVGKFAYVVTTGSGVAAGQADAPHWTLP